MPFLHFFDGFRTSHEVDKIELLDEDDLRALIEPDAEAKTVFETARGLEYKKRFEALEAIDLAPRRLPRAEIGG